LGPKKNPKSQKAPKKGINPGRNTPEKNDPSLGRGKKKKILGPIPETRGDFFSGGNPLGGKVLTPKTHKKPGGVHTKKKKTQQGEIFPPKTPGKKKLGGGGNKKHKLLLGGGERAPPADYNIPTQGGGPLGEVNTRRAGGKPHGFRNPSFRGGGGKKKTTPSHHTTTQ